MFTLILNNIDISFKADFHNLVFLTKFKPLDCERSGHLKYLFIE